MTSSIDNLTAIAADLNAAGKTVKVTVLKPRKAKKRVKSAQSAAPKRFSKSGIDNLEAMRKKTRRVKKKKRKTRA